MDTNSVCHVTRSRSRDISSSNASGRVQRLCDRLGFKYRRKSGWEAVCSFERGHCTSTLCWVCAGMLGERGLGLVVHIPSGCVAKINIPWPWPWPWPWPSELSSSDSLRGGRPNLRPCAQKTKSPLVRQRSKATGRRSSSERREFIAAEVEKVHGLCDVYQQWGTQERDCLVRTGGPPIAENKSSTHRTHRKVLFSVFRLKDGHGLSILATYHVRVARALGTTLTILVPHGLRQQTKVSTQWLIFTGPSDFRDAHKARQVAVLTVAAAVAASIVASVMLSDVASVMLSDVASVMLSDVASVMLSDVASVMLSDAFKKPSAFHAVHVIVFITLNYIEVCVLGHCHSCRVFASQCTKWRFLPQPQLVPSSPMCILVAFVYSDWYYPGQRLADMTETRAHAWFDAIHALLSAAAHIPGVLFCFKVSLNSVEVCRQTAHVPRCTAETSPPIGLLRKLYVCIYIYIHIYVRMYNTRLLPHA